MNTLQFSHKGMKIKEAYLTEFDVLEPCSISRVAHQVEVLAHLPAHYL